LPTYRCRNGPQDAINGEVARSDLQDGGDGLQCSSGSGGGDDGWPSTKQQLDRGGLDSMRRWHELGRLWQLGFGWQRHQVKLLFIGGRVQRGVLGLKANSILSLSFKLMRFARISERGFLDTTSVSILAL
jgi:hypothetical protein